MATKSFESSIHSLVDVLGSSVGKVVGKLLGAEPRSSLERLAVVSILPIITTSIFYYTRTTVEVIDPEQSLWVQLWISQQKNSIQRVRRLFLLSHSLLRGDYRDPYGYNSRRDNAGDDDISDKPDRFAPPKLTFLPARGASAWAWFGFWPISVSSLESSQNQDRFGRTHSGASGYKLTIWFAPSGANIAKNVLFEGRKMWLAKRAQKTEVWLHRSHHSPASFDISTRKSRPLNSVIVADGIKDALLADTKAFLQSEEWYVRKGIPYRRGYLLEGPPGCGKTSLVTALAGKLRLPIVLVPLGSKSMGDESLMEVLAAAPRDSIVLIEDVDCAFRTDDSNDPYARYSRSVTMSGFLNAIDGVAAQEGRLIFLTTNHKEQLSEALIRPGRVDAQYHIGYASKTGAGELFDQFFSPLEGPEGDKVKSAREAFVDQVEPNVHSFAELQGVLMQARNDPELAASSMRTLFDEDTSNGVTEPRKLKGYKVTRRERLDDDLESHLAMIKHAAECEGCKSSNCKKVKENFEHIKTCDKKPKSSCRIFTNIMSVIVVHAQKCTAGECRVPYCDRIRKKEAQEEVAFVESLFEESNSTEKEESAPVSEETESMTASENGASENDATMAE